MLKCNIKEGFPIEKSGFFNSNNGDRIYDATNFATYFGDLVSNGIFYVNADNLKVTASSGMEISVNIGSAWINGYHYRNTSPLTLVIATANGVNPRIDRIVVQWSNVDREIKLAVLTGTPVAVPTAPALTRTADTYELGIADILVPRAVVSITDDNIADTRLNSDLCGLVNSLVSSVYE